MSATTPHPTEPITTCDECGAAVAPDQRYCVQCGAHRRTASDPAGRYFSEASAARTRVAAATAAGASAPRRKRRAQPGLLAALLIALVPVAAAIGVAIGRSSNSGDQALITALAKQRAQYVTGAPSSGSTANTGHASNKTLQGGVSATSSKHHHAASKSSNNSSAPKPSSANNSSNQTGSGHGAKVGASVSASQAKQGQQEATTVSKKKGAGYVNEQNQLPNAVSP